MEHRYLDAAVKPNLNEGGSMAGGKTSEGRWVGRAKGEQSRRKEEEDVQSDL